MYLKRTSFPLVLLILVCGIFFQSHGGPTGIDGGRIAAAHHHGNSGAISKHVRPCIAFHTTHQPGEPRRGEKRHGKSLVSHPIEAAYFPEIQPAFTYCQRHYSLFLPGGSCQKTTGPASLRGPPAQA